MVLLILWVKYSCEVLKMPVGIASFPLTSPDSTAQAIPGMLNQLSEVQQNQIRSSLLASKLPYASQQNAADLLKANLANELSQNILPYAGDTAKAEMIAKQLANKQTAATVAYAPYSAYATAQRQNAEAIKSMREAQLIGAHGGQPLRDSNGNFIGNTGLGMFGQQNAMPGGIPNPSQLGLVGNEQNQIGNTQSLSTQGGNQQNPLAVTDTIPTAPLNFADKTLNNAHLQQVLDSRMQGLGSDQNFGVPPQIADAIRAHLQQVNGQQQQPNSQPPSASNVSQPGYNTPPGQPWWDQSQGQTPDANGYFTPQDVNKYGHPVFTTLNPTLQANDQEYLQKIRQGDMHQQFDALRDGYKGQNTWGAWLKLQGEKYYAKLSGNTPQDLEDIANYTAAHANLTDLIRNVSTTSVAKTQTNMFGHSLDPIPGESESAYRARMYAAEYKLNNFADQLQFGLNHGLPQNDDATKMITNEAFDPQKLVYLHQQSPAAFKMVAPHLLPEQVRKFYLYNQALKNGQNPAYANAGGQ